MDIRRSLYNAIAHAAELQGGVGDFNPTEEPWCRGDLVPDRAAITTAVQDARAHFGGPPNGRVMWANVAIFLKLRIIDDVDPGRVIDLGDVQF
jgi:hypothetical protein